MLASRKLPQLEDLEIGKEMDSILQSHLALDERGSPPPEDEVIKATIKAEAEQHQAQVQAQQQIPRLVSRVPIHKLNARIRGKPKFFKLRNLWHTLIQMRWFYLFAGITGIWILFHLIFGLLFFLEAGWNTKSIQNLHEDGDSLMWVFFKAVFFSVQTGQTIGYGWWAPLTPYSNTIVMIDSYTIMVFQVVFTGLMVAKLSRPSLLARRILFSDVAVISRSAEYFKEGATADLGRYLQDGKIPSLQIRVINASKTMLCCASCRVLLLRQVAITSSNASTASIPSPSLSPNLTLRPVPSRSPSPSTSTSVTDSMINHHRHHHQKKPEEQQRSAKQQAAAEAPAMFEWKIDELNFELNEMKGRIRGAALSTPLLPLPWIISHPIDNLSPLYNLTPEDLEHTHAEIIVIIDGVDEGCSNNVQARWSYLPSEIRWGATFESCVEVRNSQFIVNADRISSWHWDHTSMESQTFEIPLPNSGVIPSHSPVDGVNHSPHLQNSNIRISQVAEEDEQLEQQPHLAPLINISTPPVSETTANQKQHTNSGNIAILHNNNAQIESQLAESAAGMDEEGHSL